MSVSPAAIMRNILFQGLIPIACPIYDVIFLIIKVIRSFASQFIKIKLATFVRTKLIAFISQINKVKHSR